MHGIHTDGEDSAVLSELQRRLAERKFYGIEPYPWQKEFFAGGLNEIQRMLMAANRVGKTFCAAYEVVCHATGEYPEWWEGYRIDHKVPLIWVSSLTNETSRDIIQKELLGEVGSEGTGMIPKDLIVDVKYRQAGIPDVADTILVKHKSGGTCTIKTKVAEQGYKKYQGTAPDIIWQDEEPDHFKLVTECFTRLMTTNGRYLVTFTPLMGETELVIHFKKQSSNRRVYTATWDDADHLDQNTKDQYLDSLPEHERDARSTGVPMMGEGAVFKIPDKDITCEPFKIPDHFFRIAGVDYGTDHPAAGAWIAIDADTDTIYLYDEYAKAGELPPYHASAIKKRDPKGMIPVIGPHDGLNEEKSSGQKVAHQYAAEGVNMLPFTACYEDGVYGSQPVEPVVQELAMRMRNGTFKVFSTCTKFLAEKRGLHRKNNKIIAIRDDVFKALTYAVMTRRYACPNNYSTVGSSPSVSTPIM